MVHGLSQADFPGDIKRDDAPTILLLPTKQCRRFRRFRKVLDVW